MNMIKDKNNPGIQSGDIISGYGVKRITFFEQMEAMFYELEHIKTGARHIHISNKDQENTFSVAFKTVPTDSTGVAHILEHTALCGSKKYPVRDPFFSMLKRSLSTFMNAFTASDWTMYPFSTQNHKDFYNLMDVYLDAAFFPKIDALSFKQEGHRLEIESGEDDGADRVFVYKGVVYNEMKGAMSSPDQILGRSLLNAIYPDTTYSYNSGGDPAKIPALTHDQLVAFHGRHYHPSNAFFYTYGNFSLKNHLEYIEDKVLECFDRIDPGTDVPSQPHWSAPRQVAYSYPLAESEDPARKYQVCIAWLTADIVDAFEVLILVLLEQILLGNAASPLRKALMDSQLGTALCDGSGFDADNRDSMFVCGLKEVKKDSAEKIEIIIFDVLKELVRNGIDPELTEAAIHQIEFHRKEVTNSPYPYGIKILLGIGGTWFHGGDPARVLSFDADLERLRNEIQQGHFMEDRLRFYLLDNSHRVRLILEPDKEMAQHEAARVTAELAGKMDTVSEKEIQEIERDTEALRTLQESQEDISGLPTLALEEIPESVQSVGSSSAYPDFPGTCYRQPTAGIFYFTAVAGGGGLPDALVSLVPFFSYAFPRMGSTKRDYTGMARLIDLYTGGIGLSAQARTRFDKAGDSLSMISLGAKSLVRNQGRMMEIIEELLFQSDFTDVVRLKSLLLQYRAGLESMVVNNGHRLAMMLAARNFSTTCRLAETWSGVHQLLAIKALSENLSREKLEVLSQHLKAIASGLFFKENTKVALVGDRETLNQAIAPVESLWKGLGSGDRGRFVAPKRDLGRDPIREGWSTSTAVSFVAACFETVRMGHEDAAALAVISKILRSMYLHREIREKGGAYGGFALYNSEDGLFSFGSYRDPHIVSTLHTYDNCAEFITSGSFTDQDVTEAILQVCSEIDKPDPPGPAARKSFFRSIVALTDDERNRFKSRLLSLSRRRVLSVAQHYFGDHRRDYAVAVISGQDKLEAANKRLQDRPLDVKVI
jgi:presequence protease